MPVKLTEKERKELLAQQSRARELSDVFLDCRALGHAWQQCAPDRKPQFGELQVFQCTRCLSIRDDIVSAKYGELLSRGYRMAPGYIQPKPEDGSRLFSAAALRAERRRRSADRQLIPVVDWITQYHLEEHPEAGAPTRRHRPMATRDKARQAK